MDNKRIIEFIVKMQYFNLKIKFIHWTTDFMSEHKLCDMIYDELNDSIDSIAEVSFGINGKPKFSDFKIKTNTKKTDSLCDILNEIKILIINEIENVKGKNEYIGFNNILEELLSKVNKYNLLCTFK